MKPITINSQFTNHGCNDFCRFLAQWRINISKFFAVFLILLICFSGSRWSTHAPEMGSFLFLGGCLLMGVGVIGRMWCSVYIAGFKNKCLITRGPYSMCRNPLYLFSSIGAAGIGLGTETFSIPLLILSAFAMYYPFVIKNEQETLIRNFSSQYYRYSRHTPIFFPRFSLLTEPQNYEINPIKIKRDLLSVVWFIWIFGMVALMVKMHQTGILPTLIQLY